PIAAPMSRNGAAAARVATAAAPAAIACAPNAVTLAIIAVIAAGMPVAAMPSAAPVIANSAILTAVDTGPVSWKNLMRLRPMLTAFVNAPVTAFTAPGRLLANIEAI